MTICTKCKYSKHVGLGIYVCIVSPRFEPYMDYTTGEMVMPNKYFHCQRCSQVNTDGNCPRYEAETSKWKLLWK